MKLFINLKKNLFIILLLGLVVSFIARIVWFQEDSREATYLGLVVPGDKENTELALSMQRGADLYLQEYNNAYNKGEKKIVLQKIKSSDVLSQVHNFSHKENISAVISALQQPDLIEKSVALYQQQKIPAVILASSTIDKSNPWAFSAIYNLSNQAKFIANYVRNIRGKKLVTLVYDDSKYGLTMSKNFSEVYARFGTKIRYHKPFRLAQAETDLNKIITELKDKKDAGVIFLIADVKRSALFIQKAHDAGIRNDIVGTDIMASNQFMHTLQALLENGESIAPYTNNILVSTPLLFDTAGELTQQFRNQYLQKYGDYPDWAAAYAYDSARVLVQGLSQQDNMDGHRSAMKNRQVIRDYLDSLSHPGKSIAGVTGDIWFPRRSKSKKTVRIGVYNGSSIVASLTQLQPLKEGSNANYFAELKQGKMLYVNDRFMYKSNVVYTGITLHSLEEFDLDNNSAVLDFSIWFRYKGKFDPADIIFPDALEDIKLTNPEELSKNKNLIFKLYRVKGKFALNALQTKRSYGSQIISISFQHRTLNRNNVIYVVDILGMDLDTGETIKDKLENSPFLSTQPGWKIEKAWISQDIFSSTSLGKPIYVGYGAVEPDFSRINMGLLMREDKINIHSIVPAEYFVYLAILGIIGTLFASLLAFSAKGKDKYLTQTTAWLLKVIFWPLSLLALGNIVLDTAINMGISIHYIDTLVIGYNILWWFIPARLIAMALPLFVWIPLQEKTGRRIPNVILLLGSAVIYIIAFLGVVAFVFDQHLTSLLATGGLFAMIIGLAVQSNIANIFSGIVVNIERPFSIGDWIKIGAMDDAEVIDMTWRTLRMRTINGFVISVPNAKASEATVINFSQGNARIDIAMNVATEYDPVMIVSTLNQILSEIEGIHDTGEKASAIFKGITTVYNQSVSEYAIRFWLSDYSNALGYKIKIWTAIWLRFNKMGLSLKLSVQDNDEGEEYQIRTIDDN